MGLGFRVFGIWFMVYNIGFKVWVYGLGFTKEFRCVIFEHKIKAFRGVFRVYGLGFYGLGFRVLGLWFMVYGL